MAKFNTQKPKTQKQDSDEEKGKKQPFSKRPAASRPGRITESRCSVCTSEYRNEIERLIVLGMAQAEVIRMMEDRGTKFSTRAMSNHKTKHMTLEDDVARRAIERRARSLSGDIEDLADSLLGTGAVLEVMRMQAYKKVVDDEMVYTPADMLAVLDRIDAIEGKNAEVQIQHMLRDFNALMAAIKDVVDAKDWDRIVARWEVHQERMSAGIEEGRKAIEAEVVKKKG